MKESLWWCIVDLRVLVVWLINLPDGCHTAHARGVIWARFVQLIFIHLNLLQLI